MVCYRVVRSDQGMTFQPGIQIIALAFRVNEYPACDFFAAGVGSREKPVCLGKVYVDSLSGNVWFQAYTAFSAVQLNVI